MKKERIFGVSREQLKDRIEEQMQELHEENKISSKTVSFLYNIKLWKLINSNKLDEIAYLESAIHTYQNKLIVSSDDILAYTLEGETNSLYHDIVEFFSNYFEENTLSAEDWYVCYNFVKDYIKKAKILDRETNFTKEGKKSLKNAIRNIEFISKFALPEYRKLFKEDFAYLKYIKNKILIEENMDMFMSIQDRLKKAKDKVKNREKENTGTISSKKDKALIEYERV